MKLSKKITLFIIIIAILLIIFSIIFIFHEKKFSENLFLEKSYAVAYSFEASLNNEVLDNEDLFFNLITKFKYNNPELEKIEIYNQKLKNIDQKFDTNFLIISVPIEISGKTEKHVKLFFSLENINNAILQKTITLIFMYSVLILLLFFSMFYYSNNYLIKPIDELLLEINNIKQGKELKKTKINNDELGTLKKAIYELNEELIISKNKIEEQNKELELKINEKTRELQDKIAELKKFEKITINRELKMIELKKKLENYEKKS
ncbi:MAG: hypothetical protein QXR96_01435 [Candidatus Woesearchaeota archaeon]